MTGHEAKEAEFKFDMKAKMVAVSDSQLLEGLQKYAALVGGRRFSQAEFNAWPDRPAVGNTIVRRFGSWRDALATVGVRRVRAGKYTPQQLVTNLENVWREMGRRPGKTILHRLGTISVGPYLAHWGSLRAVCDALARFHSGEITREELFKAAKSRAERASLPLDVRWRIFKRDHYRCAACGKNPASDSSVILEVDHITPVSRGGGDEEANLRTLCRTCNRGRVRGE